MLPYTAAPLVESVLGTMYDPAEKSTHRPMTAFLDGWGPTAADQTAGEAGTTRVASILRAVLGRARSS
jgi:hypothetical protein